SAVNVVPIFVPRIIPIDCLKVKYPVAINPTTRTITAELLWIIAVMIMPVNKPFIGLFVKRISHTLNLSPVRLYKPVLITVIPNKKMAINTANNDISSIIYLHPYHIVWTRLLENDYLDLFNFF